VTAEIEEALREIAEVDVIESTSATGISLISVELVWKPCPKRGSSWSGPRSATRCRTRRRGFPVGAQ
jgi:hypothetical protein